ncbi:TRAP transporter large permease subunit [Pikeienuella sp. HZG-20]|uniref:TRAP transporter large permease n=1 Tax=Paludibacillus litoralis TaxID=3133267 RepID=UPI0030EE0511
MTVLALLALLGALILIGLPIAFALGLTGVAALLSFGLPIALVGQTLYGVLDNHAWAAIPLYLLMGSLLVSSGVASDIYRAVHVWTRHLPGGMGVATVLTAAVFAAVSGTSIGTVAAMASVTVPEMIARGYNPRFAYGTLAAAGTLGILIPPSITMIIFGMVTTESIATLFMAGVAPGILLAFLMCCYCVVYSRLWQKETLDAKAGWSERIAESRRAIWGVLLIVLVLGGIYSGALTVTESAGFGALLALALSAFVYRSLTWPVLVDALENTLLSSCMILLIVALASLFGSAVNMLHIPQDTSDAVLSLDIPVWGVIVLFSAILFVMGQFLDVPSIMLITLPIFYPALLSMGVSPVWFAILMTMNMEVATITPPVGLNIYVLKGAVPSAEVRDVVIGCVPFIGLIVAVMLLIAAFPCIALWLPGLC